MLLCQGILVHLADRFALTYNLDREELLGEAQLECLRAVRRWTREGGASVTTYVYKCVTQHFVDKLRVPDWRRMVGRQEAPLIREAAATDGLDVNKLLSEISRPAALAVCMVLDHGKRMSKFALQKRLGWSRAKLERVSREIMEAIQ